MVSKRKENLRDHILARVISASHANVFFSPGQDQMMQYHANLYHMFLLQLGRASHFSLAIQKQKQSQNKQ